MLRTKSIVAYPWLGILLLALAGYGWVKKRMSSGQKLRVRDGVLIAFAVLIIYGGLRFLGIVIDSFSQTSALPCTTRPTMDTIRSRCPGSELAFTSCSPRLAMARQSERSGERLLAGMLPFALDQG